MWQGTWGVNVEGGSEWGWHGMGGGCQGEVVAALVAIVPVVFVLYM